MKKKKWNRFLSVVVTAAMLVAPLQGFSFVDDLFTTAGVTTKASAQDIAQTDTSQKIGTYPYFANEPADCDASAKLGSEQNPLEIANNMKKQGGFIPGIRPGKPTSDYLTKILNYIVFIGAVGLSIVAFMPIFFSGVFNANISFGGTSIIIIVGVVVETIKQIESQMLVRNYKGFLNN